MRLEKSSDRDGSFFCIVFHQNLQRKFDKIASKKHRRERRKW